jgi:hypothetical protein
MPRSLSVCNSGGGRTAHRLKPAEIMAGLVCLGSTVAAEIAVDPCTSRGSHVIDMTRSLLWHGTTSQGGSLNWGVRIERLGN